MKDGTRVAYQTGIAEFGIGEIVAFDRDTDMLMVVDADDGSTWTGPADLATSIDPERKDHDGTDAL